MLSTHRFESPRLAVLCSKRAPALDALLRHPHHRRLYEVACVVTSETDLVARPQIEAEGVPVLAHAIRRFHEERGASLRDRDVRREYDALTVQVLEHLGVDAVILLGYLYVVTDTLLSAFPERVLNLHDGTKKYPGLHATRDAIYAGERETRSMLHIVTPQVDAGPVLFESRPYPVAPFVHEAARAGHTDIVKAYAYAQREWMMRDSWGDMLVRGVESMSAGVLDEVAV